MKKNKYNYTYAKFSDKDFYLFRLGGAGLGNILFPWARAVIYRKKNDIKQLNSTWFTLKIGTFFRRERDKRLYKSLFLENFTSGLLRLLILIVGKKNLSENKTTSTFLPNILVFKDMKNLMDDIREDNLIVKDELLKSIRPEHIEFLNNYNKKSLVVHIRLGDFQITEDETPIRNGNWNYRLPLKWYITTIVKIQNYLPKNTPIYLFSDGSDEDLKDILNLDNVERKFYGTPISDMIALSNGSIMIASASTFSMWASYLGRMPIIWFPGSIKQKLYYEENIFEGELDYEEELPKLLKENINSRFFNVY